MPFTLANSATLFRKIKIFTLSVSHKDCRMSLFDGTAKDMRQQK